MPQVVQNVNIAGCDLPLRHLKEYDNRRPMEDEGSTGGGQGRHRILLAEYDDETIVLKGYALVSFFVFILFLSRQRLLALGGFVYCCITAVVIPYNRWPLLYCSVPGT